MLPKFAAIVLLAFLQLGHGSIVSRFSSNPFFLSHFQGYEQLKPEFRWEEATPPPQRFTITFSRKPAVNPYDDHKSLDNEQKVVILSNNEKFESGQNVKLNSDKPKVTKPEIEPVIDVRNGGDTKECIDNEQVFTFKNLPHFERNEIFNAAMTSQNFDAQKSSPSTSKIENNTGMSTPATNTFKILPNFDRTNDFQARTPENHNLLNETSKNNGVATGNAIQCRVDFKLLPHFDRNDRFHSTVPAANANSAAEKQTLFTSDVEETLKVNAPDEKVENVQQGQLFLSEIVPLKAAAVKKVSNENFRKLPLFEKSDVFRGADERKGRTLVKILKRRPASNEIIDESFIFDGNFGERIQIEPELANAPLDAHHPRINKGLMLDSYGRRI